MSFVILVASMFVGSCNSNYERNTDTLALKKDTITELRCFAKIPSSSHHYYNQIHACTSSTTPFQTTENGVTGNLIHEWAEDERKLGIL
ncbi:hypothetical protein [Segetibacter koreensis]|uniref:hypothetical protein n=1 Tax=Segetibacter koreensis TaxID=398037 RepID=UPI00036C7C90|nr:hypothetical protein [Segetibacter koreensis]